MSVRYRWTGDVDENRLWVRELYTYVNYIQTCTKRTVNVRVRLQWWIRRLHIFSERSLLRCWGGKLRVEGINRISQTVIVCPILIAVPTDVWFILRTTRSITAVARLIVITTRSIAAVGRLILITTWSIVTAGRLFHVAALSIHFSIGSASWLDQLP